MFINFMRTYRSRVLTTVAFTLCALGSTKAISNELVFFGSTTVEERVLVPAKDAIQAATGISVKVIGSSSGRGFEKLVAGEVPFSISSSSLKTLLEKTKTDNSDGTYVENVLLLDEIVPIVHPSNPVESLTFGQLTDIHTGKIRNWSDVGGKRRRISIFSDHPTSGTRSVYQKIVMDNKPFSKRTRAVNAAYEQINLVKRFRGGIGALSSTLADAHSSEVKVIQTDPISRPLCVITRGRPTGDLKKVIDYLQTSEAKKFFL